jgi:hypothetical protein
MEDVQAPPVGTKGTVLAWTIPAPSSWVGHGQRTERGLRRDIVKKLATVTTVCYGEKKYGFRKEAADFFLQAIAGTESADANAIPPSTPSWYRDWRCAAMTQTIKEQILAIRDTGLTNMFDVNMVQRLAYERDFYELVTYLEEHRKEYVRFILTGEEE